MSEVRRYGAEMKKSGTSPMYASVSGQWVHWDTYSALAAQRDEGLAREAELRQHLADAERREVLREELLTQVKGERDRMIERTCELSPLLDTALNLLRCVVELDPRGEFMGWELDARIVALLASPGCADGENALSKDRFECIGKGGSYDVVGPAIGAGTLKKHQHLLVYKNKDGMHFVRTREDFAKRMKPLSDEGERS